MGWSKDPKRRAEACARMSAAQKGNTNCIGRAYSAETCAKIGAASRGRIVSAETRAKMSLSATGHQNALGYRHTPEARAKMSAALKGNKRTLGHKCTDKTRTKMSTAQKGNRNALGYKHTAAARAKMCAAKRQNNSWCGRKHTAQTRAKISAARIGKYAGPQSPRWMGGISSEGYLWTFNSELKEEVRRRDGHKCQLCGVVQGMNDPDLDVHHCDYDKRNSDPVNLVALCHVCHSRTGANRPYWEAFFLNRALARARQGLLF